jgi:hypothetical protein
MLYNYKTLNPVFNISVFTFQLFFRVMPDAIFGSDVYDKFLATCDIQDQEERVEEVKRMIEMLPKCNQNLLRHFFCVLHRIDENSKENNMDAYNLSVCVGPSILRNPASGAEYKDPAFQEQVKKETLCIQFVIENFVELFGEESLKLYGEPKTTMRQDSGTDSDSMHSILSMQESTGKIEGINPLKTEGLFCENFKKLYSSPKSGRISKIMILPESLSQYLSNTTVMGFQ